MVRVWAVSCSISTFTSLEKAQSPVHPGVQIRSLCIHMHAAKRCGSRGVAALHGKGRSSQRSLVARCRKHVATQAFFGFGRKPQKEEEEGEEEEEEEEPAPAPKAPGFLKSLFGAASPPGRFSSPQQYFRAKSISWKSDHRQ